MARWWPRSRRKAPCASANELSRSFNQFELRHTPFGEPRNRPWNGNQERAAKDEQRATPKHVQSSRVEHDGAARAFDVAAHPSYLGDINPCRADDGNHRQQRQNVPAQIAPERAREAQPERPLI